ncbi:MAG: hypothetical protein H6511_04880 [Holophagales bacterium]|nr:hypothetical protein [Holophagales bacterium]
MAPELDGSDPPRRTVGFFAAPLWPARFAGVFFGALGPRAAFFAERFLAVAFFALFFVFAAFFAVFFAVDLRVDFPADFRVARAAVFFVFLARAAMRIFPP